MKVIKGVEIVEIKDLDYNLNKIRLELEEKYGFWGNFFKAISSFEKKNNNKKAGFIFKVMLFITLIPKYILFLFDSSKVELLIKEAEIELIEHYQKPSMQVKRFRLECQQEKNVYGKEIKAINEELYIQNTNLLKKSIGDKTKSEIKELINQFDNNKRKKQNKFEFYEKCEERLIEIEEQIKVKQSISKSWQRLKQMNEKHEDLSKKELMATEFEMYEHYGDLLDNISNNLKRLNSDKGEHLEELELQQMLNQIEIEK